MENFSRLSRPSGLFICNLCFLSDKFPFIAFPTPLSDSLRATGVLASHNEMAARSIDRMSQYNSVITSTCTDKETQSLIRIANTLEELNFPSHFDSLTDGAFLHSLSPPLTNLPSFTFATFVIQSLPSNQWRCCILVNGSKKF